MADFSKYKDFVFDPVSMPSPALPPAIGSVGENPDEAGKVVQFSTKTGVPPEVIAPDVKGFETDLRAQEATTALKSKPFSDFVFENPHAAAVINDDYPALSKLGNNVRKALMIPSVDTLRRAWDAAYGEFPTEDLGLSRENRAKYPAVYTNLQPFLAPLDLFFQQLPAAYLRGASQIVTGGLEERGLLDPRQREKTAKEFETLGQIALLMTGAPEASGFLGTMGRPVEAPRTLVGREGVEAFLNRAQTIWDRQEIERVFREKGATPPGTEPPTIKPRPAPDLRQTLMIEHQKEALEGLDKTVEAAKETKLAERSPELLEKFIAAHSEGQIVSIPAEEIFKIYEAEGKTPAKGDGLFGEVPDLDRQLALARQTGREVEIPMSVYIAHLTELHDKIGDFVRISDGMTKTEIKDLEKVEPVSEMNPKMVERLMEIPREPEEVVPAEVPTGKEALAETIKSKPGANIGRVSKLFGSSLYGKPEEISRVAVKEMMQNSFDAIKGMIEKGLVKKGRINIETDYDNRTISIVDNGSGMMPQTLAKEFLEIAGTVKETEKSSGGFGIAKMLFLFGNSKINVITMRDGKVSRLSSTGPQLEAALEDQSLAPNVTYENPTKEDKKLFPEGHGTRVEIQVPEKYKDPSSGLMRDIPFEGDLYRHNALKRSPLFRDIDVKFNGKQLPIGSQFPIKDFTQFADVKFDWGEANIYVTKKPKEDFGYPSHNVHVLSNGISQFSFGLRTNPSGYDSPLINREFYIDITPRVKPEEPGYPFQLNRQGFSESAQKDFKKITNYIAALYRQADFAGEAKNFGSIQYLEGGKASEPIVLEPEVPERPTIASGIKEGDEVSVIDGKLTVNGREIPTLTDEQLKDTDIKFDELMVKPGTIDPNRVMLHDGLEVEQQVGLPGDTEFKSLIEAARNKFGSRFDRYVSELGDIFKELRDTTAEALGYEELKKEGVGLSFSKEYYGVSIRVPFSASFINPGLARFTDPVQAGVGMVGTMIHELAHHMVRSHDAEFPAEMQTIQIKLDAMQIAIEEGLVDPKHGTDLWELKKKAVEILREHKDVFDYLHKTITGGTVRPRGRELKGAGEGAKGDEGAVGNQKGPAQAGGEPGGQLREGAKGAGGEQGAGQVPGGTGEGGTLTQGEKAYAFAAHKVREELYLRQQFFNAKSMGVTEPEFKAYSKKIEGDQKAILNKAVAAAQREVKKKQSVQWKKDEARVKTEVETDLRSKPDIAAERFLRLGMLPTGQKSVPPKLNAERVDQILGDKTSLKELKAEGGVDPDELAPMFGYDTGAQLVHDVDLLRTAREQLEETPQQYFDRVVKQETAQRMQDQFGTLAENIAAEAKEIALSETVTEILTDEFKAISKLAGFDIPITYEGVKAEAQKLWDATPYKQAANYEAYKRAANKGGREAEKALLGKKYLDALHAKQKQVLSVLQAKLAEKFAKVKESADKLIERIVTEPTIKSTDQGHLDQAKRILAALGYPLERALPADMPDLNQFVADSDGQLAVANFLVNPSAATFKSVEDMNAGDFTALKKSLDSIMHVGRQVKTVANVHKAADLDNVIFDIGKSLERFDLIEQPLNPSIKQRTGSLVRYVNAWSLLVERMLDYTDKFDAFGPLNSYLDRPLRESYAKELHLTEQVVKKLKALHKYVDNSIMDLIPNNVLPDKFDKSGFLNINRRNLRHLMGYMGSVSGIEKVTEGFGVKEADVWKLIHDNATEADWKWVNGHHEIFDMLKAEADAMELRDSGVAVDPIKAQPINSPKHGKQPGGYWPLFYDKLRSDIEMQIAKKNPLFDQHYVRASTPHPWTLPRTDYFAPLDLTGALLGNKIQGMIHDIAFREAVRNAGKLIYNKEFMSLMSQKWGKERAGLMEGWLKDIANVHNVDDAYAQGAERFFSLIRQNIVSALIALNPGTYIKHGLTAASMSAERVGLKALGRAAGASGMGVKGIAGQTKDIFASDKTDRPSPEFIQAMKDVNDPGEKGENVRQFILDNSAIMRNRQRKYEDSVRGAFEKGNNAGWLQKFSDARALSMTIGRFPVSLTDAISAMPTWYAEYKKVYAETGDHAGAVFAADKQVGRAHGSSATFDKPRILRTSEAMRWVTPLYGFWNHMQNNYFQYAWDMAAYISDKKAGTGPSEPGATGKSLANRSFWLLLIPVLVEEMAGSALDNDHRGFGQRVALAFIRHFGAGYVGLRDFTNYIAHGYEPSVGLIGTAVKGVKNEIDDIAKLGGRKAASKDWLIHAGTALAFATGLGGVQPAKTASFAIDLLTGREKPKTLNQYRQGIRTGHSKPREHK